MAKRALGMIGASGSAGILQTDLAKALQVENKNLFHHMKPLVKYNLITRHPVASKKSFTYLCTLVRFFFEEDGDDDDVNEGSSTCVKISSKVFKEAVIKVLTNSKEKTFSTKELYSLCCPEGTAPKDFRRCILALEHEGLIEIVSTREIGGVNRLVRLNGGKSNSNEDDVKDDELEDKEESLKQFSAPLLSEFIPIEKQVYDFVAEKTAMAGSTLNEIAANFGLRKKFAFRLMERLVDKKTIVNTEMTRQAEFVGRERRYKFTVGTATPSSVASDAGRDSINRIRRQEAIMELLSHKKIIEVNRAMINQVTTRLGQSEHVLDKKTIKRTLNLMKADGLLEVHNVGSMTFGTRISMRQVVTLPHVKSDSEEFMRLMAELDRIQAASASDNLEMSDDFVDCNKYDFGFAFGFLERLKMCHLYLAEKRFS
jgi:Fe2+ or Zn2+ uptake regulation protein